MGSPNQHAAREKCIYTHRLSALSLLTLAFFIPVAAGCAEHEPPAVDDIEADTADDQADGPAGLSGQYATSAEVQEATGMTYFTINEVGENLEVHGFLPDGTEAAGAVFEDRGADLYATLSAAGGSPQILSVTTASVADGTHLYGTLDGQPISLLVATEGDRFGGDIQNVSINPTVAFLLMDFARVGGSDLRAGPRWWACTKCSARVLVVLAGAAILAYFGYILWPHMATLIQGLRLFGVAYLRARLIALGIGAGAVAAVVAAITKLEEFGDKLIEVCTECFVGPNPPPPPPLPPPAPPPQEN